MFKENLFKTKKISLNVIRKEVRIWEKESLTASCYAQASWVMEGLQ